MDEVRNEGLRDQEQTHITECDEGFSTPTNSSIHHRRR
jgi:hypothetical protein